MRHAPATKGKTKPEPRINRLLIANSLLLKLPDIQGEHIAAAWHNIGMCESGFNGAIPLSWQTIKTYTDLMNDDLDAFEVACIRDMSEHYCYQLNTTENLPPPYMTMAAYIAINEAERVRENLRKKIAKK